MNRSERTRHLLMLCKSLPFPDLTNAQTDKERLKCLIVQTLSKVCKQTLAAEKFTMEGLLGITMPNNEVMLISLKEEVTNNDVDKTTAAADNVINCSSPR